MKATIPFFVIATLAISAGSGTALWRYNLDPWNYDPSGKGDPRAPKMSQAGLTPPTVMIPETEHDFGSMDLGAEGSHDFEFRNTGRSPLELAAGETSCGCTALDLQSGRVLPGDSTIVTVNWEGKDFGGPFRETATILTNDPRQPRITLTIAGHMVETVRCLPESLVFARIEIGKPQTAEIPVFCYVDSPPLELPDFTFSNRTTADNFDVSIHPMPAGTLAEESQAHSGCIVRVTVKPGLPLGAFQQRILLRTNLEAKRSIVIPVKGRVGDDLVIFGQGWNESQGVLDFDKVERQKGAERRLTVVIRGDHRKEVQLTSALSTPDFIEVELPDESERTNGKSSTLIPLTVRIPPGSPTGNYLGPSSDKMGSITLKTTHPDVPTLQIRVRFGVGP